MATRTRGVGNEPAISSFKASSMSNTNQSGGAPGGVGFAGNGRGYRSAGFGGQAPDILADQPAPSASTASPSSVQQAVRIDAPRPSTGNMLGMAAARPLAAAGKSILQSGGDIPKPGGGIVNPWTKAETFPLKDPGSVTGTPLEPPVQVADASGFSDTMTDVPTNGGFINPGTGAETFGYTGDVGDVTGTALDAGDAAGGFSDAAGGISDFSDAAGGVVGDVGGGFADAAGGFGDAAGGFADAAGGFADAAGSAIPYVGSFLRLAQGDIKGAIGSAAGAAIGTAIFPGVGTAIGAVVGGMCFITEAVMAAGGQDAGPELDALRAFRDQVLMQTPQGQALVQEYEQIAPIIVEAIGQREDAMDVYRQIYSEFIQPAVEAVQRGNMKGALEIYAQMLNFVTPFATEVMDEGDPATAAVDQLGSHGAMVAHDDMTGFGATGGIGTGNVDWSHQQPEMQMSPSYPQQGGAGGAPMPMPQGGAPMQASAPNPAMQPGASPMGAAPGQRPAIGNVQARRF